MSRMIKRLRFWREKPSRSGVAVFNGSLGPRIISAPIICSVAIGQVNFLLSLSLSLTLSQTHSLKHTHSLPSSLPLFAFFAFGNRSVVSRESVIFANCRRVSAKIPSLYKTKRR